jgi:hypothetical protein
MRSVVRAASAAVAGCGVAVLLLAGCGSTHKADPSGSPTSSSTAAAAAAGACPANGQYPASPTVSLLQGMLRQGLDPNVPAADKVALVQGTEADPDLFNRMGAALRKADFASVIHDVADYCNGTANADATLTIYGQSTDSQVPLVAENGRWKLDKTWACGLAKSLQQTSPVCG